MYKKTCQLLQALIFEYEKKCGEYIAPKEMELKKTKYPTIHIRMDGHIVK